MPDPISGKTQPEAYVEPDADQPKGKVDGDKVPVEKTGSNLTIQNSADENDDPYGAHKLLKDLATSMQSIPKPAEMTPEAVAQFVEQISIKFMQAGAVLAKTVIEHDQKRQDIDTDATNKKIKDNAKKMAKLEKKEKLFKALKVGILLTALLISGLTAGAASGLVAFAAGASFVLTAVMGGLDLSGEMSKLAKNDPKAAEAIQIVVMILQMALAMAGLAAAIRAAAQAAENIADAAVQEGSTLAETGAEGATQVTSEAASNTTSSIADEAAAEGIEDVLEDAVEDGDIAAKNISKVSKSPEGIEEPEEINIPREPDGIEGVEGADDGVSDGVTEQMETLAKMIKRFASFLQFTTSGANMSVQMQAAHIKKQISDNDADLTEIQGDLQYATKMVQKWIKFLDELVADNKKTFENTADISKNVHQAQIDSSNASVVTGPSQSGTA